MLFSIDDCFISNFIVINLLNNFDYLLYKYEKQKINPLTQIQLNEDEVTIKFTNLLPIPRNANSSIVQHRVVRRYVEINIVQLQSAGGNQLFQALDHAIRCHRVVLTQ